MRPLTLLIGENSTGKTTFLALDRIAWDLTVGLSGAGATRDSFNDSPFHLGGFDQIASTKRASPNAAQHNPFIGAFLDSAHSPVDRLPAEQRVATIAHIADADGLPAISDWAISGFDCSIRVVPGSGRMPHQIVVTSKTASFVESVKARQSNSAIPFTIEDLQFALRFSPRLSEEYGDSRLLPTEERRAITQLLFESLNLDLERPIAFAPIRTHPERTYDPAVDVRSPQGAHVPMALAQLSLRDTHEWSNLRTSLVEFGKSSGLFSNIQVRRKGNKDSDPFQIEVGIWGSVVNLVDAGYGISQALPIIVDAMRAPVGTQFLIQQPEIHLHPRAQAELGSLFGQMVRTQGKSFVIETHSDYIIDRVRMDVRDGKGLTPDDVAILYFEKGKSGVQIHEIRIDEEGNILSPPPSYREFFLAEGRRLLGF